MTNFAGLVSLKYAQYSYVSQVLASLHVNQYMPETLMQKNNMGIIGNDKRINKNNG